MTSTSEKNNTTEQDFSETAPVVKLVAVVDYIFDKLGISGSSPKNPPRQSDPVEKLAGLTNTYLKPTRISRKAEFADVIFFYGQKFNLLPEIYETVPFDVPADVISFIERRLEETLTDYMSVHKGNFRLNLDIKNGMIESLVKTGFDDQFTFISKDTPLTVGDLEKIIQSLLEAE